MLSPGTTQGWTAGLGASGKPHGAAKAAGQRDQSHPQDAGETQAPSGKPGATPLSRLAGPASFGADCRSLLKGGAHRTAVRGMRQGGAGSHVRWAIPPFIVLPWGGSSNAQGQELEWRSRSLPFSLKLPTLPHSPRPCASQTLSCLASLSSCFR